ncbi:InlB B-repeat-containing protein [Tenacibaculum jejuense]|uniref:Bacterial repeat domain-containing protein n=1 Tax=Tenacibaculum jejuense TaxID=584609 RepID=A0A238UCR7_9FLAO|nr:InlB B-repeat-containing protein [Tenacibaculum jejuense]SNR16806.1 Protein of unknown function precursor containing a C-terminal secretion signal [Tenacibaculum jejuense]
MKNKLLLLFIGCFTTLFSQNVSIPDPIFKSSLTNNSSINTNNDSEISVTEAEAFTGKISVSTLVTNLQGIEAFTNITEIESLSNRRITSINVTKNTKLKVLNLQSARGLTSLDISKNLELTHLNCRLTSITSLDVSKNKALKVLNTRQNSDLVNLNISNSLALEELYCGFNSLGSLDVSKHIKLKKLECSGNGLTSLNVSKNTDLIELDCRRNDLARIDLSKNTLLQKLDCSENNLLGLDISKNLGLIDLDCGINADLKKIDVSKHTNLTKLNVGFASLSTLDVTKNTALIDLNCRNNDLRSLNVSKNTNLITLNCQSNLLVTVDVSKNILLKELFSSHMNTFTNIDVSKNIALTKLIVDHSNIKKIDVSKNIALKTLDCGINSLTSLKLSENINLDDLDCSFNDIEKLDLSKNVALRTLDCSHNKIQEINVSNSKSLTSITCDDNDLRILNIANGNNTNFRTAAKAFFDLTSNANLTCITVDDAAYSNANWSTFKDNVASFSTDICYPKLTITAENGRVNPDLAPTILENYTNGDIVNLTAVPDQYYQFDGWSGDASGSANPFTLTMNTDKNITALFSKIQVTLVTNATNGTIEVDKPPVNGTYDINSELVLTAVPDTDYQFDGWSGDASGTTNPLTITANSNKNITALFSKIQTTLTTTSVNGTITVDKAPVNGSYDINTELVLTAIPDENYQFDGWSGDVSEVTNPLILTMDTDKNITALFSKIQTTLTTTSVNGTITVDKAPVNGSYDIDTELVLTAIPDENYQFDGWSGDISGTTNPISVVMNSNKNITALFSKIQVTLTTTSVNGTIEVDKPPVNGTYDINTEIILTAVPAPGYQFDSWSGDASGTTNPLTIIADTDKNITASFIRTVFEWLGTEDNNWNNSNNWSTGILPTSIDDVVIDTNLANYPTVSTEISVNTITLNNNTTLIANAPVNGKVIYTRTLTNNRHLISSPVINQTFEDFIRDNNLTLDNTTATGIATYNNNTDLFEYKRNDVLGNINQGLGFALELEPLGDVKFIGNLNSNTVSYPTEVGTQNNNNLIGNPYTSYVNSSSFLNENSALLSEGTVWLWNGIQYEAYTLADPIEIAPTQGFFVDVQNNGSIIFNQANQSHQTTNTFMRSQQNTNVELTVNGFSTKVFYVANNTTNGFDNGYDGSLFSGQNYDFAVYTKLPDDASSNKKLAIQALPNSNIEQTIVPIGLIAKVGDELNFSISASNLSQDTEVYLEDRVNSTFTNLSQENYKTTLTSNLSDVGRFYLHLSRKSLSTEENDFSQNIAIYKSSENQLTVKGLEEKGKIILYSLLGEEILKNKVNEGTNILTIPEMSKGIYLVKLTSGTKIKTQKMIMN